MTILFNFVHTFGRIPKRIFYGNQIVNLNELVNTSIITALIRLPKIYRQPRGMLSCVESKSTS